MAIQAIIGVALGVGYAIRGHVARIFRRGEK
jgi:hypothetical protein